METTRGLLLTSWRLSALLTAGGLIWLGAFLALLGLAELDIEATVEKVNNYREIVAHGVIGTPGLVVDGKVVSSGRVPSKAEIAGWLGKAKG